MFCVGAREGASPDSRRGLTEHAWDAAADRYFVVDAATGEERTGYRASRVTMRDYTDDEMESYIASGDPFDKAGAYAVQHEGFAPAAEVKGCYLNVVGLPVCTLLKEAERSGLRLKPQPSLPWEGLARCPECAKRSGLPVRRERSRHR